MGMKKFNGRIEEIGYWFCGHVHSGSIRVQLGLSTGGHVAFYLQPNDKKRSVEKFLYAIGRCEEDGAYIEDLKGEKVCAFFSDDGNGKICGVSSFMDENGDDMVEV